MGRAKAIGVGLVALFVLFLLFSPMKAIIDGGVEAMGEMTSDNPPFVDAVFNNLPLIILGVGIGVAIKMMFSRRE